MICPVHEAAVGSLSVVLELGMVPGEGFEPPTRCLEGIRPATLWLKLAVPARIVGVIRCS
jgi:hypothetical protein